MDTINNYYKYINVLNEELIPAMGCTEPISVAYAAAIARKQLGTEPTFVDIRVSANIIKNVKSVVVPNTNGMRGLAAAAAAGIISGDPSKELEVISLIDNEGRARIAEFLNAAEFHIDRADTGHIFDICITLKNAAHSACCRITDSHTNVVYIEKDGNVEKNTLNNDTFCDASQTDRQFMNIADIINFAKHVRLEDIQPLLCKQTENNLAIAGEGIKACYGAEVGRTILHYCDDSVFTHAKAYAAAASDARMSGCNLPVTINSGSGNQGITASVPVIVYAKETGISEEIMYRALALSNLITIHLKTGIGCLSAYCGVVSASCGAAAGICYMTGGKEDQICQTIMNALAINSGMICDGANTNCAAKIASSLESGFTAMRMALNGKHFGYDEGILSFDIEKTIENIGKLASKGMIQTDREIISMMI